MTGSAAAPRHRDMISDIARVSMGDEQEDALTHLFVRTAHPVEDQLCAARIERCTHALSHFNTM